MNHLSFRKAVLLSHKVFSLKRNFCSTFEGNRGKNQATPTKQELGTSWKLFSTFTTSIPVLNIWECPQVKITSPEETCSTRIHVSIFTCACVLVHSCNSEKTEPLLLSDNGSVHVGRQTIHLWHEKRS